MNAAALLLCGLAVTFTSCSEDDPKTNPEPPVPTTDVVTFEGEYFSSLIDSEQYGGPLLYPEDLDEYVDYAWRDETTTLASTLSNNWGRVYGGYMEGGIAISNYVDADIEKHATATYQLSVPVSSDGNFAVVNTYAFITLDEPKVIHSMDIMNTTYALGTIKYGNGFAQALTEEGSFFTLVATGYAGEEETGVVRFDLARDGKFVEEWTTVDFSSLGAVDRIDFTIDGSDKSFDYVNSPAYFAIDNVVISK